VTHGGAGFLFAVVFEVFWTCSFALRISGSASFARLGRVSPEVMRFLKSWVLNALAQALMPSTPLQFRRRNERPRPRKRLQSCRLRLNSGRCNVVASQCIPRFWDRKTRHTVVSNKASGPFGTAIRRQNAERVVQNSRKGPPLLFPFPFPTDSLCPPQQPAELQTVAIAVFLRRYGEPQATISQREPNRKPGFSCASKP